MGDIQKIRPDVELEDDDELPSITLPPQDVVALSRVLNFADGVISTALAVRDNGYMASIERDVKLLQTRIPR